MGRRERGVLNPFLFQELRRTYTVKEIACIMGYTESGLWRWCVRNNVITARVTDWELREEIKTKTPKEIAFDHNMSVSSIYCRLERIGIYKKNYRGIK